LLARVYDLFIQGGAIMYPLLCLSVLTIASALTQSWFWFRLLCKENQVAREVLKIASYDRSVSLSTSQIKTANT
jgi:biopolymer transport protein ExbB